MMSSSLSCAAAQSSSTRMDARCSAPVSARSLAPARVPPPLTFSTLRRGTISIAGPKLAATAGSACPPSTCPRTFKPTRRRSTSTAPGRTSRPTATCGTRECRQAGGPYYYGRWTTLRPWGWTWIGSDPWAWPTHHYGRWGFSAGAWFWIPGRTWGPAWVSWAYAPGYVSWCPLGWNNRAVFGFNAGIYGGHRYNGWNAWTVVPHNGFGRGYVNVNVVNHTRIDVRTRNAFVIRDGAPDNRGYAVPRSSAAIRSVGARGPSSGANGSYSASRTAPAGVSSSNTVAGDTGAAFRSRRSSSAPLTGSGYPAPARQPRDITSLPAPTRQAVPRSRDANATSPPSTRSTSSPQDIRTAETPDTRSFSERRAVPRASAPIDQGNVAEPARRSPAYRTPDASSSNPYSRAEAYRAVPRTDRPARESDSPAPAPSFGTSPQRSYRSGVPDASDRMYRATPRSTPDNSSPTPAYRAPEGYRSRPGPERSAPAPSAPATAVGGAVAAVGSKRR